MTVIGMDIVSEGTIERWLERYDRDTLAIVFTPAELAGATGPRSRVRRLASALALKEAVGKALGTGLAGLQWTDITGRVCADERIVVRLSGDAERIAAERGIERWTATWACVAREVVVVAVGERREIR